VKRTWHELLEVVTVGLPFCAFKIVTGLALVSIGWPFPLGWGLIVLGALDGVVNVANLAALAVGKPRLLGVCSTQIIARRFDRQSFDDLGIAVDVMLSFALVAIVIGFGLLSRLSDVALRAWSIAVVLNVLGAGVGRLSSSLGSLKERERSEP
jgi:hypothetical protein